MKPGHPGAFLLPQQSVPFRDWIWKQRFHDPARNGEQQRAVAPSIKVDREEISLTHLITMRL